MNDKEDAALTSSASALMGIPRRGGRIFPRPRDCILTTTIAPLIVVDKLRELAVLVVWLRVGPGPGATKHKHLRQMDSLQAISLFRPHEAELGRG